MGRKAKWENKAEVPISRLSGLNRDRGDGTLNRGGGEGGEGGGWGREGGGAEVGRERGEREGEGA